MHTRHTNKAGRCHRGFDIEQSRSESRCCHFIGFDTLRGTLRIFRVVRTGARGLISDRGFNGTRPGLQLGTVAAHHLQVASKVHEGKRGGDGGGMRDDPTAPTAVSFRGKKIECPSSAGCPSLLKIKRQLSHLQRC